MAGSPQTAGRLAEVKFLTVAEVAAGAGAQHADGHPASRAEAEDGRVVEAGTSPRPPR